MTLTKLRTSQKTKTRKNLPRPAPLMLKILRGIPYTVRFLCKIFKKDIKCHKKLKYQTEMQKNISFIFLFYCWYFDSLFEDRFKKCRVADPDPNWIRIQSGQWIRISIRNPDPDLGGQKWPTKVEKIKKFHVLKCWMFSFESSAVTWTSFKEA